MNHIPQAWPLFAVWSFGENGSVSHGPVIAWREDSDGDLSPVVIQDGAMVMLLDASDITWATFPTADTAADVARERNAQWHPVRTHQGT